MFSLTITNKLTTWAAVKRGGVSSECTDDVAADSGSVPLSCPTTISLSCQLICTFLMLNV